MNKISQPASNAFCPQALFLYGTYREDGRPNYGLFCWATYCYTDAFQFVACIGEDKLTRDRIRQTGMFSASLVTEDLLPGADWCGNHAGYDFDKSAVIPSEKGALLDVPVPVKSVWTFELKVDRTLEVIPGSEIYVCSIVNVLADQRLAEPSLSFEGKLKLVRPVVTMHSQYIPIDSRSLGGWGAFSN